MRIQRTLLILVILLVSLVGVADAQTVKIGTATDLTGIGALIAKAGVAGMEIGVEELNKRGGLLGRKVELIVRDSKLRPEIGARELKELVLNEKIDLALGPVSSGVGLAMSEVAKEFRVPICMHTANTERMTVERGHRYIFQLVPNTFMEGTMVGMRAAEKKEWKRYVLIGPDYDYGRTVAAAFTAKIKQLRPDVEIVKEFWPKLGEPDFTSYVTGILAQKPDVLYSILWGGDMLAFIKQAKPYGLFDKLPLIWLSELDTLRVLGPEMLEGVMGHTRAPFYAIKTKEMGPFIEKYREKTKDYPSDWAIQAYDCVSVLAQAVEAAKSLDKEKVVDVLASGRKFKTLRGEVYFRKEDHMGSVPYYAGVVKKTPSYSFMTLTDIKTYPAEQIWRPVTDIDKEREKVKK
jgi:branched-chain amino acid transport system substrate-binding protein